MPNSYSKSRRNIHFFGLADYILITCAAQKRPRVQSLDIKTLHPCSQFPQLVSPPRFLTTQLSLKNSLHISFIKNDSNQALHCIHSRCYCHCTYRCSTRAHTRCSTHKRWQRRAPPSPSSSPPPPSPQACRATTA